MRGSYPRSVHSYEAFAVAYFVILAAAAMRTPGRRRARAVGITSCIGTILIIVMMGWWARPLVRQSMPLAYIAASYWIPVMLVNAPPDPVFEAWLLRSDAAVRALLPSLPRAMRMMGELAYLACYVLVPGSYLFVLWTGTTPQVTHLWNIVLPSGFVCYGTLPWLRARPPRAFGPPTAPSATVARVNAFVLGVVSHGLTTFPSGHVAMSFAVAAAMLPVSPVVAVIAVVIAAGVAVGAASGRYHYVIDVLLGIAVAAVFTLLCLDRN